MPTASFATYPPLWISAAIISSSVTTPEMILPLASIITILPAFSEPRFVLVEPPLPPPDGILAIALLTYTVVA
jgi:hypothetical protein